MPNANEQTEVAKKSVVAHLALKSTLSDRDAEMLLMRCEWNLDVALAFWTLASAYNRDVFYVFEKSRWLNA